MRDLFQDARFASRPLRKNKAFTVIAVTALAQRGGSDGLLHPRASSDASRPDGSAAVRMRKVRKR